MNELKSIDNEYQKIKEQRKGEKKDLIKCFKYVQDISNLINRINKISENVIQQKKSELIKIYEKEKKEIINDIINLTYIIFMNDEDDPMFDPKLIIEKIQKSFFYEEFKNNYKLKEIEIKYIMIEAEQNNNYLNALEKLKEMQKNIADYSLNNEINNSIEDCHIEIANNEKREIKKLLEKKEFDIAIKKYQNLLNNQNLFKFIYKEYLTILEHIIKIKINNETKEIPEIQIYKGFIKQNKDKIKNIKRYIQKLNTLELNKNLIKEEEIKDIGNIDLIFSNNNHIQIERKNVDYYLEQIEKDLPEGELDEKLKDFIYKQINKYDEEIKNNYVNTKK